MSRQYRGESAEEWLGITCPDDCPPLTADDYEEEEKPILCAGCDDSEVDETGEVCADCLASTPEDWVNVDDYNKMREAARKFEETHKQKLVARHERQCRCIAPERRRA